MKEKTKTNAYITHKTHLFRADEFICSACGHIERKKFRRCPSCGADMSKRKYEPTWVDEAEIMDIISGD